MKSHGVYRSVQLNRPNRTAGDAPNLGRVSRFHGKPMPKDLKDDANAGEVAFSQGQKWMKRYRRNVLLAWSLLLIFVALCVLSVFFWLWLKPQILSEPDLARGDAGRSLRERVVSKFESPTEEEAVRVVKQALAVREPAEVGRYFRTGSADPAAVIGFLEELQEVDGPVGSFHWLSSMDANGLLLDGVLVKGMKDGIERHRLALLTPDEMGTWQIDFEAFARQVTPSWKELLAADGPGEGVVRVVVAKDSYFNGPFSDEQDWDSYGMASPDCDTLLMGYCRRGSPQARALAWILASWNDENVEQRSMRVTLELKRPEGAELRQFEISRVLAEDWVLGDKPFDEAFEEASMSSPDLQGQGPPP